MIKTFDTYTTKLTEYEVKTLLPLIIKGMKCHEGKENAITSREICKRLRDQGFVIDDVKLRKCVKFIQYKNILSWVIATESGFFYTTDPELVKTQIESLKNRENAIKATREAFEKSLTSFQYGDDDSLSFGDDD